MLADEAAATCCMVVVAGGLDAVIGRGIALGIGRLIGIALAKRTVPPTTAAWAAAGVVLLEAIVAAVPTVSLPAVEPMPALPSTPVAVGLMTAIPVAKPVVVPAAAPCAERVLSLVTAPGLFVARPVA